MEELVIFKYQAKEIENTLRLVANVLGSRKEETCLDRQIVRSQEFLKEILTKSTEQKQS